MYPTPRIGLSVTDRATAASLLSVLLADAHVLRMALHAAHWNVTGMQFVPLHDLFGEQAAALTDAIDELAERIRFLGHVPPSTLTAMLALATSQEPTHPPTETEAQLLAILKGHEDACEALRQSATSLGELGDIGSQDFVTELLQSHEKMAWKIRSHLQALGQGQTQTHE